MLVVDDAVFVEDDSKVDSGESVHLKIYESCHRKPEAAVRTFSDCPFSDRTFSDRGDTTMCDLNITRNDCTIDERRVYAESLVCHVAGLYRQSTMSTSLDDGAGILDWDRARKKRSTACGGCSFPKTCVARILGSLQPFGIYHMARNEQFELVEAVEADVVRLMDEHKARRSDWYFHDIVPWERGESFRDKPWDVSQCTISENARTSLVLNLLTEDNLPYYHALLHEYMPKTSAFKAWTHLWTAEEGQHAIAIRSYLLASRNCDPYELEDDRKNDNGQRIYSVI